MRPRYPGISPQVPDTHKLSSQAGQHVGELFPEIKIGRTKQGQVDRVYCCDSGV